MVLVSRVNWLKLFSALWEAAELEELRQYQQHYHLNWTKHIITTTILYELPYFNLFFNYYYFSNKTEQLTSSPGFNHIQNAHQRIVSISYLFEIYTLNSISLKYILFCVGVVSTKIFFHEKNCIDFCLPINLISFVQLFPFLFIFFFFLIFLFVSKL